MPLTNSPCACACRTFGDRKALHDVWTDFAASPILTHFGWSPLVELAFDNDREVISPTTVFEPPLSAIPTHRRGDYEGHCEHLARCSSSFLAFNALPQLEQLDPPEGGAWGENTHENLAIYRKHCYPAVTRVREVQQTEHAQGLESAYIMTNGAVPWVEGAQGRASGRGRLSEHRE